MMWQAYLAARARVKVLGYVPGNASWEAFWAGFRARWMRRKCPYVNKTGKKMKAWKSGWLAVMVLVLAGCGDDPLGPVLCDAVVYVDRDGNEVQIDSIDLRNCRSTQ